MASALMTGGKLVVGLSTGSIGILSEVAHSLLDMGATALTYLAVRVSDKPPDAEHPYGHGKIESISALTETALLFVTSAWIIYEAVSRLLHGGTEVEVTWYAFAVIVVSIAIDYSRSRALMRVARETKSQALEADALHFQSDIWSSLAVLTGLVCTYAGFQGADAIAALCVACFVIRIGYQMAKRTFDTLIDTAPEGARQEVTEILTHTPGILSVERVRVREVGAKLSIDAIVCLGRTHHSEVVRTITEQATTEVRAHYHDADILLHTKFITNPTETLGDTIRVLAAQEGHTVHDLLVDTVEGKIFVSYDLGVPAHLSLAEGHALATSLEERIRSTVGEDAEINTHLEPTHRDTLASEVVHTKELATIERAVQDAIAHVPELHTAHHIRARRIQGKRIVSVHCTAVGTASVEDVHISTEMLEHLIFRSNTAITRVLVHVEPEESEFSNAILCTNSDYALR